MQSLIGLQGISHLGQQKTRALFEACIDLTKWFVKAERYQADDDMFIQLQSDMVETPGLDDGQVITLLERIGLFYQGQGMWDEALSRVEQALAACYARYGEQSEHVTSGNRSRDWPLRDVRPVTGGWPASSHRDCSFRSLSKLLLLIGRLK